MSTPPQIESLLQSWAKGSSYEACIEATAGPDDGTVLRAPTEKQGLIPLCKDTFLGKVSVQFDDLATEAFSLPRHCHFNASTTSVMTQDLAVHLMSVKAAMRQIAANTWVLIICFVLMGR